VKQNQLLEKVRRLTLRQRSPAIEQLLADRHQHLTQEGFLSGKVVVERRTRDPSGAANVVDCHVVETELGELVCRDGQQLLSTGDGAGLGDAHALSNRGSDPAAEVRLGTS
jgi:hypothetical protein